MINKKTLTIAAATAIVAATSFAPPARADNYHKQGGIGPAIQYPLRKFGENTSIFLHRGEHRKSVESMRPQSATAVVTPNGNQYVVAHRGDALAMYGPGYFAHRSTYAHRTMRSTYAHHQFRHYYYKHGQRHYYWTNSQY